MERRRLRFAGLSNSRGEVSSMTLPHALELISYGSLGATLIIIVVFRFVWRRRKPLQEP
jgi:hypothetical protein